MGFKLTSIELDTLVFGDPLLDVGHLDVAGVSDGGRIIIVGRTQVEMMCTRFDIKSDTATIDCHVCVESTCTPWVKLTVRVDGIGLGEEVLADIEAAKVAKSPVVVRGEAVELLAVGCVCIVVEGRCLDEHGVGSIADRHGKLVAGENVPAVAIKVAGGFRVTDIGARVVASVVEVDVS